MLPKSERLDTKRFNEIIASGRNINAGGFYVKFLDGDDIKFAVAVSKKVTKSAVKRHFIKRRVFGALVNVKKLFPSGHYIVFINKESVDFDKNQWMENLKNMAQKLDYK
jgi:ribonuclease P protein component